MARAKIAPKVARWDCGRMHGLSNVPTNAHRGQSVRPRDPSVELLGSPPEELELDVVRVSECNHGILCVRRLFDARMDNPEGVEALGPIVQIRALSDQELKVVKARYELVEGALGTPGVFHQTDFEPRAWFCKTRVALTFVGRLVFAADRHVQNFPIPTDASSQVGNGERWGQIARYRRHGMILPICAVGRLP